MSPPNSVTVSKNRSRMNSASTRQHFATPNLIPASSKKFLEFSSFFSAKLISPLIFPLWNYWSTCSIWGFTASLLLLSYFDSWIIYSRRGLICLWHIEVRINACMYKVSASASLNLPKVLFSVNTLAAICNLGSSSSSSSSLGSCFLLYVSEVCSNISLASSGFILKCCAIRLHLSRYNCAVSNSPHSMRYETTQIHNSWISPEASS